MDYYSIILILVEQGLFDDNTLLILKDMCRQYYTTITNSLKNKLIKMNIPNLDKVINTYNFTESKKLFPQNLYYLLYIKLQQVCIETSKIHLWKTQQIYYKIDKCYDCGNISLIKKSYYSCNRGGCGLRFGEMEFNAIYKLNVCYKNMCPYKETYQCNKCHKISSIATDIIDEPKSVYSKCDYCQIPMQLIKN